MKNTDKKQQTGSARHDMLHHLGELAMLDIAPEEEAQLEADLEEILRFVDVMKEAQIPADIMQDVRMPMAETMPDAQMPVGAAGDALPGAQMDASQDVQPPEEAVWREDIVTNGNAWEAMSANAPRLCEHAFLVPGVTGVSCKLLAVKGCSGGQGLMGSETEASGMEP